MQSSTVTRAMGPLNCREAAGYTRIGLKGNTFNDLVLRQGELTQPLDAVREARGTGEAQLRLGDVRAALVYFQAAQRIEPVDRIQRELDAARAQVDAAAKNETRRPVATVNLDQDRLVHPMVRATGAAR